MSLLLVIQAKEEVTPPAPTTGAQTMALKGAGK